MPEPAGQAAAILLVESDITVRQPLTQYLRDCGHEVIEAATTDEALAVLGSSGRQVDIVLSSVAVNGSMNGFGLSKWLRANLPEIDIALAGSIAAAAAAAADICSEGPRLGYPYHPQTVVDHVKRLRAARERKLGRD